MLLSFILGLALPKALAGHSSLSQGNDLIVVGGQPTTDSYSSSIFKLTCINGKFTWEEMDVKLQTASGWFVADFIPNSFTTPTTIATSTTTTTTATTTTTINLGTQCNNVC